MVFSGLESGSLVTAVAVLLVSCGVVVQAGAQNATSPCQTKYSLANGTQLTYTQCRALEVQGATLAWNYIPGDNSTGSVLDMAFTNSLLSSGGWVGWGINPVSTTDMVGSSVLVAFMDSSTGGGALVLPYKLTDALLRSNPPPLVSGATDLAVLEKSVEIDAGTLVATIFAQLQLDSNTTTINQVWNKGPSVSNRVPAPHDSTSNAYLTSLGGLDVTTGTVVDTSSGTPPRENIHGVLNAISWGFLLPVGIMVSRYLRPFKVLDPSWFYLHVVCQTCGYILGLAGWALGWKILDPATENYQHRNIGISLFVLATVQITAMVVRPSPEHKARKFWNVYHLVSGYAIIILGIINVFKGFDLLQPPDGWKHAYIGIIIAFGQIALFGRFVDVGRLLLEATPAAAQAPRGRTRGFLGIWGSAH